MNILKHWVEENVYPNVSDNTKYFVWLGIIAIVAIVVSTHDYNTLQILSK